MFDRFTHAARRVVVIAQEEARMLGHHEVDTVHLVVALAREGKAAGLDHAKALTETVARIGEGDRRIAGHIPFTAAAKGILEQAARLSTQLGHNSIDPAHILLALIHQAAAGNGGIAGEILRDHRFDEADANIAGAPGSNEFIVYVALEPRQLRENPHAPDTMTLYPSIGDASDDGHEHLTALTLALADGEYFEVHALRGKHTDELRSRFTSYPDAYRAAKAITDGPGTAEGAVLIARTVTVPLTAKDPDGNDVQVGATSTHSTRGLHEALVSPFAFSA